MEEVGKRCEETNRAVVSEIGMIKRRHSRLLSLFTTGLEGNMQEALLNSKKDTDKLAVETDIQKLTIEELEAPANPQPTHPNYTSLGSKDLHFSYP